MNFLGDSIAQVLRPAQSTANKDIDKKYPIQQYSLALMSIKNADLVALESLLSKANLTHVQLSELLFHATYITNHKIAAALIKHGASIAYNSHYAWHMAVELGNDNVIAYFKTVMNTQSKKGIMLYAVV